MEGRDDEAPLFFVFAPKASRWIVLATAFCCLISLIDLSIDGRGEFSSWLECVSWLSSEAMNKTDEESEALHRQLLEHEMELSIFVQKYKRLRNLYHRRALIHLAAKTSSTSWTFSVTKRIYAIKAYVGRVTLFGFLLGPFHWFMCCMLGCMSHGIIVLPTQVRISWCWEGPLLSSEGSICLLDGCPHWDLLIYI